ncbi:hypothetical protein COOONC_22364 [Cooperia oncophora]
MKIRLCGEYAPLENKRGRSSSRTLSRSRSRTRSRSPVRSPSPRDRRGRSRSRSPHRRRRVSRSASGSRSGSRSSDRRDSRRSRSRSPRRRDSYMRSRRDSGDRGSRWRGRPTRREDPDPCRCLGCFNLSVYTTEKDLRELFGEFGEIEKVELVYDHPTGRSRGFGFVYFERLEDACVARDKLTGQEIDGHKIRVDYSLTKRAHTPTPGQYMGAVRGGRRTYGYGSGGYRTERRESYRDGYVGRSSR